MKKKETLSVGKTEVNDVSRRNFLKMTGIMTLGIPLERSKCFHYFRPG
jgi:hypothetical protein